MAAILALSALLWTSAPVAQTLPEDEAVEEYERHRALLLPERLPLYLHPDAPPFVGALNTSAIYDAVRRHLRQQPYLEMQPTSEAVQLLRSSRSDIAQALADATVDLGHGKSHFFGFNIEAAIDTLQRVLLSYERGFGEFTATEEYAQAQQFLAYALMERAAEQGSTDDTSLARKAFQEMIRLAPHIVLDPDRQPPERVALYDEARHLFLDTPALRRGSPERARAICSLLDIEFLFVPRLVHATDASLRFELDIY